MTDHYQVMPPLTDDEYTALRDDIETNGIMVPVVYDQHGNVLDGHHRLKIAAELEIDNYPTEVHEITDDQAAREIAFTLNLARRHLSRQQKRELIAAEIGVDPDRSDRAIGRMLGVDHKTVGSVRRELAGEIPHPDPDQDDVVLDETEDEVREALTGAVHDIVTDEQRAEAERITTMLRAVLIQFHDAITEAWDTGLPSAHILDTITESLATRCPVEVRDEAQRMLSPLIAELAIAAACERQQGGGA